MDLRDGKLLIIIAIFFFGLIFSKMLSKLLSSFFQSFFQKNKKKQQGANYFENLIQRESLKLRSKSGLIHKKQVKKKRSSIRDKYKNANLTTTELDLIVNLFEKIEWGGSEQTLIFQKKILETTRHQFRIEEIIDAIRLVQRKGLLFSIENYYPSLQNIRDLVQNILILQEIISYLRGEDVLFVTTFCEKKKFKPKHFLKSCVSYFLKFENLTKDQIIQKVQQNKYDITTFNLEKKCTHYLYNYSKSSLLNFGQFIHHITADIVLFQMISPINHFDRKSKKAERDALQLLNINIRPKSSATLKKAYRSQVLKKHPDQMGRYKVPEAYKSIVTSNFQQIQLAYDFLSKNL